MLRCGRRLSSDPLVLALLVVANHKHEHELEPHTHVRVFSCAFLPFGILTRFLSDALFEFK